MTTPENKNTGELSADQQRFQYLTKQLGLEDEEAFHAIGRRRGAWPKHQRLTRQEQLNMLRVYLEHGLTEKEAERIVGLSSESSAGSNKSRPARAKDVATLDWMPAKKAFDLPSPGHSRKGLLK